jgi:hypothetical protein
MTVLVAMRTSRPAVSRSSVREPPGLRKRDAGYVQPRMVKMIRWRSATKRILALMILVLAIMPASANELVLRCNYGIVSFGARVDLDHSIVTVVYDHGGTERQRARITDNVIVFVSGAWTVTVNRITGAVTTVNNYGATNRGLTGRCSKAEGF